MYELSHFQRAVMFRYNDNCQFGFENFRIRLDSKKQNIAQTDLSDEPRHIPWSQFPRRTYCSRKPKGALLNHK